uniref:Uncharacterized protein n=1 Tax=Timema poppense TaxID=170557 RepID=A0A7R9DDT8_TIMPO|nr:unnamed protein product [Timema poppensis]
MEPIELVNVLSISISTIMLCIVVCTIVLATRSQPRSSISQQPRAGDLPRFSRVSFSDMTSDRSYTGQRRAASIVKPSTESFEDEESKSCMDILARCCPFINRDQEEVFLSYSEEMMLNDEYEIVIEKLQISYILFTKVATEDDVEERLQEIQENVNASARPSLNRRESQRNMPPLTRQSPQGLNERGLSKRRSPTSRRRNLGPHSPYYAVVPEMSKTDQRPERNTLARNTVDSSIKGGRSGFYSEPIVAAFTVTPKAVHLPQQIPSEQSLILSSSDVITNKQQIGALEQTSPTLSPMPHVVIDTTESLFARPSNKSLAVSNKSDVLLESNSRRESETSSDSAVPVYVPLGSTRSAEEKELTCDILNKFSSIFVYDLKDSVPKDPLTSPWIKRKTGDKDHHTSLAETISFYGAKTENENGQPETLFKTKKSKDNVTVIDEVGSFLPEVAESDESLEIKDSFWPGIHLEREETENNQQNKRKSKTVRQFGANNIYSVVNTEKSFEFGCENLRNDLSKINAKEEAKQEKEPLSQISITAPTNDMGCKVLNTSTTEYLNPNRNEEMCKTIHTHEMSEKPLSSINCKTMPDIIYEEKIMKPTDNREEKFKTDEPIHTVIDIEGKTQQNRPVKIYDSMISTEMGCVMLSEEPPNFQLKSEDIYKVYSQQFAENSSKMLASSSIVSKAHQPLGRDEDQRRESDHFSILSKPSKTSLIPPIQSSSIKTRDKWEPCKCPTNLKRSTKIDTPQYDKERKEKTKERYLNVEEAAFTFIDTQFPVLQNHTLTEGYVLNRLKHQNIEQYKPSDINVIAIENDLMLPSTSKQSRGDALDFSSGNSFNSDSIPTHSDVSEDLKRGKLATPTKLHYKILIKHHKDPSKNTSITIREPDEPVTGEDDTSTVAEKKQIIISPERDDKEIKL